MVSNTTKSIACYQFEHGIWALHENHIIVEAQVSLTVNGDLWFTWMCTPVHLEALAVGFLYNEGLISSLSELASVRVCPAGDNVDVWLSHLLQKPDIWRRTSGCTGGITSVDTTESHVVHSNLTTNGSVLEARTISSLINNLFEEQHLYRLTGGVHTSILTDGINMISAEDIGRHNTLDKIAGRQLLEDIHIEPRILLSTGRLSSEMLQKASRLGAKYAISKTSPTSLSIRLADSWGLTLIGYARRDRFKVYTHPEAIKLTQ
jgi:FdhD protein